MLQCKIFCCSAMHYSGSHRASNYVSRNHTAHFFRFAKSAKFTNGPCQALKDRIDIVNCETINVPGRVGRWRVSFVIRCRPAEIRVAIKLYYVLTVLYTFVFVSNIREKTVDEFNSTRVLVGCWRMLLV